MEGLASSPRYVVLSRPVTADEVSVAGEKEKRDVVGRVGVGT